MTKALNGGGLPLSGGTLTGDLILNGDPTVPLGAATKQYCDAISAGLDIKSPCRLATTAALTVTYSNGAAGVGATLTNAGAQAALSLDGVATVIGNRILVKNQASTFQNGIYQVTDIGSGATNWILTRTSDYDTVAEIGAGDFILITAGSTQANTAWIQTATVATIGTDPITFTQFGISNAANTTLSNLGVTAVNTDLIPAADGAQDLGTDPVKWGTIYVDVISDDALTNTQPPLTSDQTLATTEYVDDAVAASGGGGITMGNAFYASNIFGR